MVTDIGSDILFGAKFITNIWIFNMLTNSYDNILVPITHTISEDGGLSIQLRK